MCGIAINLFRPNTPNLSPLLSLATERPRSSSNVLYQRDSQAVCWFVMTSSCVGYGLVVNLQPSVCKLDMPRPKEGKGKTETRDRKGIERERERGTFVTAWQLGKGGRGLT